MNQVTHAPHKTRCAVGGTPAGSNAVFSGVNWKTVSIATAQARPGTEVRNYHGSPAVGVDMRTTEKTQAWCGNDGSVSFESLTVTQHARVAGVDNSAAATDLPLDHIWLTDA